jgi:hypothetical protein
VPIGLKSRVWSTWRGFTHAKGLAARQAARNPYFEARAAAIDHVTQAQAPLL